MKLSAGYTESIGTDLGIVGAAVTEKALPKFSAELLQGAGCQCVKLTFAKYGHMGVYIESRRGTGAWEFLAIDTESPYIDERPLLVAGTTRSPRIPHALLGQRHPERRLDRCGEGDRESVMHCVHVCSGWQWVKGARSGPLFSNHCNQP
jgi:hypothetical protein